MKKTIEQNFDVASSSYEKVSLVQKLCGLHLTNMLGTYCKNFSPTSILDVGSGTGYIPVILQNKYPDADYTLIDISRNMLNIAKRKFINKTNFTFCKADIETYSLHEYELIISNLCLQWMENLERVIQKLYQQSHLLAFTCLLSGTFHNWNERLNSYGLPGLIKSYPDFHLLHSFMQTLKPSTQHLDIRTFSLLFNNPVSLIRYLKRLGANTTNKMNINFHRLLHLVKRDTSCCYLDYKVIFVLLARQL